MYAWEKILRKKVTDVRDDEMSALIKAAYMNSFTTFLWTSAPFLVALASFATFVLIDPVNNILDASTGLITDTDFFSVSLLLGLFQQGLFQRLWVPFSGRYVDCEVGNRFNCVCEHTCELSAFVSLTLFNLLRIPLNMLPMLIVYMVQVTAFLKSLRRERVK